MDNLSIIESDQCPDCGDKNYIPATINDDFNIKNLGTVFIIKDVYGRCTECGFIYKPTHSLETLDG